MRLYLPLMTRFVVALLFIIAVPPLCAQVSASEQAVREVLEDQKQAWNEGDIERFMQGYVKSDQLRFASEGTVLHGWSSTLERYQKKYPGRAAMGKLDFTDLDVSVLAADAAFVFGRWKLEAKGKTYGGLFTLLFRKTEAGWKIVHDHTSSSPASD